MKGGVVGFLGSKARSGERLNEEISEKGGQEACDQHLTS